MKNLNNLPLRFYSEIYVDRPLELVWRYFNDLSTWNAWSPICVEAHIYDEHQFVENCVLCMQLKILGVTFNINTNVTEVKAPAKITWQKKLLKRTIQHTYTFVAQDHGTLISNEEVFYGLFFPLKQLVQAWFKVSNLNMRSLRGLKRELEKEDFYLWTESKKF